MRKNYFVIRGRRVRNISLTQLFVKSANCISVAVCQPTSLILTIRSGRRKRGRAGTSGMHAHAHAHAGRH